MCYTVQLVHWMNNPRRYTVKTLKIVACVLFVSASLALIGLLGTTLVIDAYHGIGDMVELRRAERQMASDYLQALKRPAVIAPTKS